MIAPELLPESGPIDPTNGLLLPDIDVALSSSPARAVLVDLAAWLGLRAGQLRSGCSLRGGRVPHPDLPACRPRFQGAS